MPVPDFLYGTAWKEDRTPALTELALRTGFPGHRHRQPAAPLLRGRSRPGRSPPPIARASSRAADLFLQTKFTYQGGQDHRLPYDPAADLSTQVAQSMASSLEHLGTDHVDSYVLHGPASGRGWTDDDAEVWAAMVKERDAGRTRVARREQRLPTTSGADGRRPAPRRPRSSRTAASRARLGPRRPRLLPGATDRLPGVLAAHRQPGGAAPPAGRPASPPARASRRRRSCSASRSRSACSR